MRALVAESVVQALGRGATIVTANERTARGARRAWDERQRACGMRSWEPARALSRRGWLASCWHALVLDGVSDRVLLNTAQERRVWQGVLAEDVNVRDRRDLDALAAMCAEAYALVCEYGGRERLQALRGGLRGDAAALARWVQMFEQQCRRERLLTASALPGEIAQLLTPETMPTTDREIVLAGFDELTPAMEELLRTWRERGGRVEVLAAGESSHGGSLVRAPDRKSELQGAARWVRAMLAGDPEMRIGLVVADLGSERDEIESVLRSVITPELEDIERDADGAPFEFSLGRPLVAEPLIRAAIDMLAWVHGTLSLASVERLLLGPGFAGQHEERAARGELVRRLHREVRLLPEATIGQVVRVVDELPEGGARLPELRRGLRGLGRSAFPVGANLWQSFAVWADYIRGVLAAALWAQDLSSRGYQVRERWEGVLDVLSSLDFRGETVPWAEVAGILDRLVRETIFAPERRDTPVQVLGPSEAAGSVFDALWVMRTGEMQWPPERVALPLLPGALGHGLGIPGFDRTADRRRSAAMTERLRGSATEVVFSFAEKGAEGGQQRPAAEVIALGLVAVTMAEVAPPEPAPARIALERVMDRARISPLRNRAIGGGVRVLDLQAQCGFRAFAELRLQARELEGEAFGLSAGERGSAVHRSLETLWDRLQSQERLLALPEAERWAVIEAAVDAGLSRASCAAEGAWARSYLEIQRERMQRLLRAWLKREMERPAFVVEQQEAKVQALQVGPLELSVRVDRVDLVNGARVLLDYKTGMASTKQWRGDRPDRPQVPLYAVLANATVLKNAALLENAGMHAKAAVLSDASRGDANGAETAPLGAVAFAKVVPGTAMGLEGYEREGAGLLPRAARMEALSFAAQVRRWSEVVARLATEFAEGDARVRPKQFPTSCAHCGQRVLCRVEAEDFEGVPEHDDESDLEDGLDEVE